jgi:hypothetical protein
MARRRIHDEAERKHRKQHMVIAVYHESKLSYRLQGLVRQILPAAAVLPHHIAVLENMVLKRGRRPPRRNTHIFGKRRKGTTKRLVNDADMHPVMMTRNLMNTQDDQTPVEANCR